QGYYVGHTQLPRHSVADHHMQRVRAGPHEARRRSPVSPQRPPVCMHSAQADREVLPPEAGGPSPWTGGGMQPIGQRLHRHVPTLSCQARRQVEQAPIAIGKRVLAGGIPLAEEEQSHPALRFETVDASTFRFSSATTSTERRLSTIFRA